MNSNKNKYIENIICGLILLAFWEYYIAEYFMESLYSITSVIYLAAGVWLTIELILRETTDKIIRIFYSIILFCFFSFLINFTGLRALLLYYKYYILPLVICIWIIRLSSYKFLLIFITMFFINSFLNVGWLLKINPLPNNYADNWADFAIGTAGSVFFAFLAILFVIYGFIYRKNILTGFSTIMLLITNSFTLIALSIPSFFSASKLKLKFYLRLVLLLISAVFIFITLFKDIYEETMTRVEIVSGLNFAKLDIYDNIFTQYEKNPHRIFFGFGPGSRSSIASELTRSEFYKMNIRYYEENFYIPGGSIMDKYYSGITSYLWEIGIIGFGLIIYLFCLMLFNSRLSVNERKLNLAFFTLFILWSFISDSFRYGNITFLTLSIIGILSNGIEKQIEVIVIRVKQFRSEYSFSNALNSNN